MEPLTLIAAKVSSVLQSIGIGGCTAITIILIVLYGSWAEGQYTNRDYATVQAAQFTLKIQKVETDVAEVKEILLRKELVANHQKWCGSVSQELKDHWWELIQDGQKEYREVTGNGPYSLPPCPPV